MKLGVAQEGKKNSQAPIVEADVPSSFAFPCKKEAKRPNLVSSKLSKMMLELVAKKCPIMLTSESFFPEAEPAFNSGACVYKRIRIQPEARRRIKKRGRCIRQRQRSKRQ